MRLWPHGLRRFLATLLSNVLANSLATLLVPGLPALALSAVLFRSVLDLRASLPGSNAPVNVRVDVSIPEILVSPPPPQPVPVSRSEPSPPPGQARFEPPYASHRRTCTDDRGNEGTFEVVLFSRAYSWVQGDTDSVELNQTASDFPELLRTSALAQYLRKAPEVIAVGTASCEGYPEHRDREVRRALNRANRLVGWIETVRTPRPEIEDFKPVKPLVLGVFARECRPGEETWPQRRVVLLAVFEHEKHLAFYDCLRKALEHDEELSYLATEYTPGLPSTARVAPSP
jgi:hypothetical protein